MESRINTVVKIDPGWLFWYTYSSIKHIGLGKRLLNFFFHSQVLILADCRPPNDSKGDVYAFMVN